MLILPWWMKTPRPKYRTIASPPIGGFKPRFNYGLKPSFYRPHVIIRKSSSGSPSINSSSAPQHYYKPIYPRFGYKRFIRKPSYSSLKRRVYGFKPRWGFV